MKMTLCVTVEGMHGAYYACKDLPNYQQECFEPIMTGDVPFVSVLVGDVMPGSLSAKRAVKTREDTAKELASELVPMIVEAMKSKDTHNGY